jgi:hypothetical protein
MYPPSPTGSGNQKKHESLNNRINYENKNFNDNEA